MHNYDIIWEYFVNLMEVILFFFFIQSRLKPSTHIKNFFHKQCIFLFLRYATLCLLNRTEVSFWFTVTITCILEILFALIFYENSFGSKIFWGGIFSVICMISEYIPFFIVTTFCKYNPVEILSSGEMRIPFTTLYLALIAVITFFSHFLNNEDMLMPVGQKIAYIIISIVGIAIGHFIILTMLDTEREFPNSSFSSRLILVNLCFIGLFLALLLYIYELGIINARNRKLLEEQKTHELEELEYQNLLKSTESLREMKHDIQIHLNTIQSLASGQKISDLLSYIDSYYHSLENNHPFLSTGNIAIDCILSSKLSAAEKNGIHTDFSVVLPTYFPLDALSLSSLLGNLWNNAIEANTNTHKKQNGNPFIHFYIKPYQDMLIIHIENSYSGELKRDSAGGLLSQKSGSEHGIGMKRITDIVTKAGGLIHVQTQNNIFTVHILLPQGEVSNENDHNNT